MKKNYFHITFLLFLFSFLRLADGWSQTGKCPSPPPYDSLFKRNVYSFVEEQPEYAEGTAALMKYIAKNVTYLAVARENGLDGTAYILFIVESDGTIKDIIPNYRRNSPFTDETLIKIIKGMPPWKPGKCNGEPVAVKFSLPLRICLK
jgi:periplasmic protein TonB